MRTWIVWLIVAVTLTAAGLAAFSLLQAQEGPAKSGPNVPPQPPATKQAPPGPLLTNPVHHDLGKFSDAQKRFYFSAGSAVGWLQRANRHRDQYSQFYYVSTPALWLKSKQEPYLRQAAAAVALAKAARYFGDDPTAEIAMQTILRLLLQTEPDNRKTPQFRYPTPAASANRLTAAGLLIRAISELPLPQADLLDQAELLCRYLHRQQRPDGSLTSADNLTQANPVVEEDGAAAEALHGLLRSCQHRPAPWKLEIVRKAFAFYHPRWRAKKNLATVTRFSAAYTEAFLLTKQASYAEAVLEMNDWLCQFQYVQQGSPPPQGWLGGFMTHVAGKAQPTLPDITAARYAEALADACRAARQLGDARRHPVYLNALESSLDFVCGLQFTEGNTKHFHMDYREEIKGAFFVSREDGNLRLEATQQAVCAMLQYLAYEGTQK